MKHEYRWLLKGSLNSYPRESKWALRASKFVRYFSTESRVLRIVKRMPASFLRSDKELNKISIRRSLIRRN